MLEPIKEGKEPTVKDVIPTAKLEKKIDGLKPIGKIEKDHNYLYDLAELDDDAFMEEQETRFLLSFGTSFHVFQYVRRIHGNTESLQILGDIDAILTNKIFVDAYESMDKEILDSFWFNFSAATKLFILELTKRLLLISK